jgi:hypothetical protein
LYEEYDKFLVQGENMQIQNGAVLPVLTGLLQGIMANESQLEKTE